MQNPRWFCLATLLLSATEASADDGAKRKAPPVKALTVAGDTATKVDGELSADDPRHDTLRRGPCHYYDIKLEAGVYVRIDLKSTAFDAYLYLTNSAKKVMASDDDSGGGFNARIDFKSPAADTYRIIVTSFDKRHGPYSLAVRRLSLGESKQLEKNERWSKLNKAARTLYEQGRYRQAEALLREALALRPDEGASYSDLALVVRKLGQYHESELLMRQALAIDRKVHGDNHPNVFVGYNNLAANMREQRRYQEAEQLDRKVLAFFQKTYGEDHRYTATAYGHVATDLGFQRQFAEAEKFARTALAIDRKLFGDNHVSTLTCCNTLAGILARQHRYQEAEQLSRHVLKTMRDLNGEEHRLTGSSYNNLAVFLRWQGKYQEAEELDLKALAIYRKALGEDHDAVATSHDNLGLTSYYLGDFKKAEERFLTAARCLQQARQRVSFTGLGRAAFTSNNTTLIMLAAVLSRNGKPAEAWKYLEENMARGLLDDFAIRNTRPLAQKEIEQEETLQNQLARCEQHLRAERKQDPAAAQKLSREYDQLMAQLHQFQASMQSKYGVTAGQVYGLAKIQASLPPDAALVRWFDIKGQANAKDPDGEHWGVIVRRHGEPVWVKLKGTGPEGAWRARDDDVLTEARRQLLRPNADYDWDALVADLVKQRLTPLRKYLHGIRHLIILPSLASQGIPVEVYAKDYLVSYAPSATVFAWLRENPGKFTGTGDLLALADPVFSAQHAQAKKGRLEVALRDKELRPLPGTRAEVKAIAGLFKTGPGKVTQFIGADASLPQLDALAAKNELARYRYVHLATHGFADAQGGLNSYVALTSLDPALMSHGRLTAAHMLRTWKLNADLVTLSACQTGLGEYLGGEGYVGFAQALFLAGARSLVLSQWPVSDWSTTLLMERFYQNLLGARAGLKQPLPKAQALAEAKHWLRGASRREVVDRLQALHVPFNTEQLAGDRPFEHPHYWAAFVLVGDSGS